MKCEICETVEGVLQLNSKEEGSIQACLNCILQALCYTKAATTRIQAHMSGTCDPEECEL